MGKMVKKSIKKWYQKFMRKLVDVEVRGSDKSYV